MRWDIQNRCFPPINKPSSDEDWLDDFSDPDADSDIVDSDDDLDNYTSIELGFVSKSNLNRRQDAEVDVLEEWFSILESTDATFVIRHFQQNRRTCISHPSI